jgi:hypothetical protein
MMGWIVASAALGYIGGLMSMAALAWYWSRRDLRRTGEAVVRRFEGK